VLGHADAGTEAGPRTVDAARDYGTRPDAIITVDTGVTVWPIIPGCVSGLPPSPRFTPSSVPPVTISCASTSPLLLNVTDAANQGMIFNATLDPPIDGFLAAYGADVCAPGLADGMPVELFVRQGIALPGDTFSTTLRITPVGPAQSGYAFPLTINTRAIDFTVDPAVIDFGTVYLGSYTQMPVMVTNALDGAPFENIYAAQPQPGGPFSLFSNRLGGPSLHPGDSQPLLVAYLNAQALGTFENTFLVSPFTPGVPIDPSCGVIRTVTMRVQVVVPGKGPPPGSSRLSLQLSVGVVQSTQRAWSNAAPSVLLTAVAAPWPSRNVLMNASTSGCCDAWNVQWSPWLTCDAPRLLGTPSA
jgi:hypothetical protein